MWHRISWKLILFSVANLLIFGCTQSQKRADTGVGLATDPVASSMGIRLNMPSGYAVLDSSADLLRLQDRASGGVWQITSKSGCHIPANLDIRSGLQEAFERQVRAQFEETSRKELMGGSETLRTSDPQWSPIVEQQPQSVSGGRAFRLIHRLTYAPSSEVVVGRLLVSVSSGTIDIAFIQRAKITGTREATLMMSRLSQGGPLSGEELQSIVGGVRQSDIDNPRNDSRFPDHPLTQARAAMAWLIDPAGGNLKVTQPPDATPSDGSTTARSIAECSLTPLPLH